MNLVLLFEEDFVASTRVRLTGRRLQHVLRVQHAQVGEVLRVGLINEQVGTGLITALSREALDMDVSLSSRAPPAAAVTLLLALPRPKSVKRVVQAVTAMGVKRIILIGTWRVEKSFWTSSALNPAALRDQMILGLEQARDTILPEITLRPRFKPFVEDELPGLAGASRKLLAHPPALHPCPRAVQGPVTLAVGPEGGFIPYEVEMFERQGFEPVTLGERRLRVEHAVPAILGRLL